MPPIRRSKSVTAPSGKRTMHEINHEPCPTCGLVVRNKCDIARHQRQHAENREEIMTTCPWLDCEYKSLQRSNVTVHARKQHNWEIHHCRPPCKFSAVLKKDIAQHRQAVHGTKCTITEWEAEGPIDPDRSPRKPCKKKQKTLDASVPSSISEEQGVAPSARHIPTFPRTARYLEPSFDDARDAAYRYGAYEPKYGLDTCNFPAWLLWNQWRMFEKFAHAFPVLPPTVLNPSFLQEQQQERPAQQPQLQLSWNSVAWNTIPPQERGNLLFSFENPSPAQQVRQQLQMWNRAFKNTIYHSPTAHCPSAIPGSILGGLPQVPFENLAPSSSSLPAQQQLQQPKMRDPAIEKVLYSRFPLTYKTYKELQAQQQLTAQQQQRRQQKLTWNPVMENTAIPEASTALKTLAPDMGAKSDALNSMEHLSSWNDVAFPTGLNDSGTVGLNYLLPEGNKALFSSHYST